MGLRCCKFSGMIGLSTICIQIAFFLNKSWNKWHKRTKFSSFLKGFETERIKEGSLPLILFMSLLCIMVVNANTVACLICCELQYISLQPQGTYNKMLASLYVKIIAAVRSWTQWEGRSRERRCWKGVFCAWLGYTNKHFNQQCKALHAHIVQFPELFTSTFFENFIFL